ncbi:MAG: transketolase C-terminal domain-containing protein, partial [Halobacteriaceae archaeon]
EVFWNDGLGFIFSTRSPVPYIHDQAGNLYYEDYEFTPGKDEVIRDGDDGYIVSYGAMLYRCIDAAARLREDGIDVGVINKPTLNVQDYDMLEELSTAPFVLVAEAQNAATGLGVRFGTWLLQHGFTGAYDHMGVTKEGHGGVYQQIPHQELSPEHIIQTVRALT